MLGLLLNLQGQWGTKT